VLCVDLEEDKEYDFWKSVYFPQLIEDHSDIDYMFRLMVQNNILHLYVQSIEGLCLLACNSVMCSNLCP